MTTPIDALEAAMSLARAGALSESVALAVWTAASTALADRHASMIEATIQRASPSNDLERGALRACESVQSLLLVQHQIGVTAWVRKRHEREAEQFAREALALMLGS